MQLQIHIPLAKIDEEKRLVIGRAVQEVPDRSGEIIDYASARGAFETWSNDFLKQTRGLSKGNLRVMHDPKRVAGKVVDLAYNDDEKAIEVVAKVVDDQEWRKVVEGVYTGFSVGGSYLRKWKDEGTGLTRYTPKVTELSLVDMPCIPTARIAELVKADGTVQELHLRGRAPRSFAQHLAEIRGAVGFAGALAEIKMRKGWDERTHPREHDGKFSSKTGEIAGRAIGAVGLGALGLLAGRRYGPKIGEKVGERVGRILHPKNPISSINGGLDGRAMGAKYGQTVGAVAGVAAGYSGGAATGKLVDERGRRRRAAEAGKLDAYLARRR